MTRAVDSSDSNRHFPYLRTGSAITSLWYGDALLVFAAAADQQQMEPRARGEVFVAHWKMNIGGGRDTHT